MVKYISHPKFRDVFIEIVKITYRDNKRVKCKIRWWNKGCTGNPWLLFPESHNYEFTLEKWNEFILYEPEEIK